MRPKRNKLSSSDNDDTRPPFAGAMQQRLDRASAFDVREHWWRFIDTWEERRSLRLACYGAAGLLLLSGAVWFWAYPAWTKRNAFSMARQWIQADRLQNAGRVVQQILADYPENPDGWRLAAELARRRQNKLGAAGYSRRATTLAPDRPELTAEAAADALVADAPEDAEKILAALNPADLASSAPAQRVLGEIARRRFQLTAARDHFEAALRLDGPAAINEVPLGLILLQSREIAERQRGLALLRKWSDHPTWGANALRQLLSDALARDDRATLADLANRLRAHPRCTLGDVPNCLLALARAEPAQFAAVLATLEKNHAAKGDQAALLLDWLNQIGQPAEAVRWARTLPSALTQKPPVIVTVAEALRRTSDWTALAAWVETGEWTNDVEFLRLVYAIQAHRQLGDVVRAEELWRTLKTSAENNGVRALFAANIIYTWGWTTESLALLWSAADQPGVSAEALATLARHYQVQNDAGGQYRAFRRLHSLRPQDAAITNNYIFFAALTGQDSTAARNLAQEIHTAERSNATYRATYAFVLLMQDRAAEALTLLRPVAATWKQSPAVAFAYGLALAANNRKADARPILTSLDSATLTPEEVALVKTALN
jgi:predicted Zn-dependent protease